MRQVLQFKKPESQQDRLLQRLDRSREFAETGNFSCGVMILIDKNKDGFVCHHNDMSHYEMTYLIGVMERVKADFVRKLAGD